MSSRRRGRFPTSEELELWAKVTRHDEPLGVERAPVSAEAVQGDTPLAGPSQQPGENAALPRNLPAPAVAAAKSRGESNGLREPPPVQPFDPRAAKRLARGRHAIDARIDLHGMRQADAHAALRHFIARCQAEGHRHVLIITGKGSSSASRHPEREFWTSGERGVLRRLVPQWLSEATMRAHIVSYTESHLRHGGSGALYVTLRKGPRDGA
jgi:DNA-nicking Smr family endonuclease